MTASREQLLEHLRQFLRTIQKPNRPLESLTLEDGLVTSGLVDSLAIVQIVLYLEEQYGIDFAAGGFDPDRLASMRSIVELIEQAQA